MSTSTPLRASRSGSGKDPQLDPPHRATSQSDYSGCMCRFDQSARQVEVRILGRASDEKGSLWQPFSVFGTRARLRQGGARDVVGVKVSERVLAGQGDLAIEGSRA